MNDRTLRVLEYKKIVEMLINKTESSLGARLAENIKPSTSIAEVETLQQETDEAIRIVIKRGSPPLGGIHDILGEVKRAEIGSALGPGSLLKIADSLRTSRRLKSFIKESKEDRDSQYPTIEGLISELRVYKDVEDSIFNAIISEEEISDNASATLRSIRRQIEVKNSSIRSKLNSIINSASNRKMLQDAIITIRGDRFVVPVKQEYRSSFPGLVHDQSSSGATLFIEPMAVVELNNQLKELRIEERLEIERILAELTEMVAEESEGIRNNQNILSNLDFIFAKGKLALEMKSIKPILNNDGYVNIKNGRHPLLKADEVVPTNIFLGKDFSTLVITGPNTGGKTVTLKTVGLLTLMAQSGLQIPADTGTHIAVFGNVYADIGDEQSIEQSLSTFSSHMTNIVDILQSVKENSLVLFDELGAGTDPTEGAALAMSILDYLYKQRVRTIATTHYSELKVYALTTMGVENASVEFDVETLSPTYRLLIGVPGKSNAFEISKRLGLQDFIIDSAKEMLSKENIEFESVLATIERDRRISEENKQESEKLRLQVEKLKEELEQKSFKLEGKREEILREARLEAKKLLREAKEDADTIIKELRNISSDIEKEQNKRIQEAKDKIKNSLDEVQGQLSENIFERPNIKPPKNLKVGDSVLIVNLNQKAIVLTTPDSDNNVTVQAGIMKVNVNISNLQKIKDEDKTKSKGGTKAILSAKTSSVRTELDLRGMSLEEAMIDVDKYLDDSYIAGLNEVTIIHGKGTGVLRDGISQLLRSHSHVKAFRLGKYGEGGSGVTIVELR